MKYIQYLLLPLTLFLVNTAYAISPTPDGYEPLSQIPKKTIDVSDRMKPTSIGTSGPIVVSGTQHYNLYITYDMTTDNTHSKNVSCYIKDNYQTWIEYTRQGQLLREEFKNGGDAEQQVVFISQGTDKDSPGKDIYDVVTTDHIHVADAKGKFVIHVVNKPGTVFYSPTSIDCHYTN